MNSWIAATSGLAGILLGVIGKYLADIKSGRRSRLFDEKMKAALRYLDAVEDYRERVTKDYSTRSLPNFAKDDEEEREKVIAYDNMREAFKSARQAETALILLVPSIEDEVTAYLTAAVRYAWHEVESPEVVAAQKAATKAIRQAIGV